MDTWITLVTSLPTENATARMRAWRALKASGAAVLRDGVYLVPDREACRTTFNTVSADVLSSGGSALVMEIKRPDGTDFESLFDRAADYASLLGEIASARDAITPEAASDAVKQARKLRKAFTGISETDFFPGEARRQADAALSELESAATRALSPDEPHAVASDIPSLNLADYQGRTWATRRRPWVDRLASSWLIRRHIDPEARILWLEKPADCPADALGFDFDGAAFTHVGGRVTFEVLAASFGITTTALDRLAAVVHFLDVGGIQPAEAGGIESVLAGLRETIPNDDRLLETAGAVFDGLLATFEKATTKK